MTNRLLCGLAILLTLAVPVAAEEVVVYTSLDKVFSEPILDAFERETGIDVKAVYDVEAAKTTGLVNRLIAEQRRPVADVFWNSEVGRTLVLKDKGVLAPYVSPEARDIPAQFKDPAGYWTGFAARARVLIYNTDMLDTDALPRSIFDLTAPEWRGRVTIAYPLFGTTATQVAALYAVLGQAQTEDYLRQLVANDVVVVDGNAVTRDLVVSGEVPIGFTDTDDANVAIAAGKPVAMLFPDADGLGTLMIPNTVALVAGAPRPEAGRRLIDYLLSHEVERRLAFSDSMQIPVRDDVERPAHVPRFDAIRAMQVDYAAIAENLEPSARFCRTLFRR
jgi:iron(III) transport system substrate-binding protein